MPRKNMNEALPAFFHTFSWENFFLTVPLIRVPVRRLSCMLVKCGNARAWEKSKRGLLHENRLSFIRSYNLSSFYVLMGARGSADCAKSLYASLVQ